jgi:hypothetical protein
MSPSFSNTRRLQVITPSKASYKDLAVYHSRDYLDTVLDPSPGTNQASNVTEFGLEDVSADFSLYLFLMNGCLGLPAISGFARLCPINWWCYPHSGQRAL